MKRRNLEKKQRKLMLGDKTGRTPLTQNLTLSEEINRETRKKFRLVLPD
jgi:Mg-chelatase subunit ChlD